MKEGEIEPDSEDDDEDDSDYEDNAGEYALYDSPLENTDELLFFKETLETIHNMDPQAFQFLMSAQSPEEADSMKKALDGAMELKQRELSVRSQCDQLEAKLKAQGVPVR